MRRSRSRTRNLGAVVLGGLAFVAWLGCGTSNGDATQDPNGAPTDTTPTSKPTSTRPDFDATFPEDSGSDASTGDGGQTCNDPSDVGGAENTAKDLGTIDDHDSSGSSFSGVVNGAADVDFYKFTGTDTSLATVDPHLESASSGVEMCMFVSCLAGSGIDFKSCSDSGVQSTSGIGNPGCCFTAPGKTTLDYNCLSTSSESATVFIRIKQTTNLCLDYTASYHF